MSEQPRDMPLAEKLGDLFIATMWAGGDPHRESIIPPRVTLTETQRKLLCGAWELVRDEMGGAGMEQPLACCVCLLADFILKLRFEATE